MQSTSQGTRKISGRPQELGKGKEGFSSTVLRKNMALLMHFASRRLDFRTVRKIILSEEKKEGRKRIREIGKEKKGGRKS